MFPGFEPGWIHFDDERYFNKNYQRGSVPDGEYEKATTKIRYCCREDGVPLEAIYLPTDRDFYLLRRGNECQQVKGDHCVKFIQPSYNHCKDPAR